MCVCWQIALAVFNYFISLFFDSIEFVFHVVITVTDLGIVKSVVLNSPGDHRVRNYTIKSIGSNKENGGAFCLDP